MYDIEIKFDMMFPATPNSGGLLTAKCENFVIL